MSIMTNPKKQDMRCPPTNKVRPSPLAGSADSTTRSILLFWRRLEVVASEMIGWLRSRQSCCTASSRLGGSSIEVGRLQSDSDPNLEEPKALCRERSYLLPAAYGLPGLMSRTSRFGSSSEF